MKNRFVKFFIFVLVVCMVFGMVTIPSHAVITESVALSAMVALLNSWGIYTTGSNISNQAVINGLYNLLDDAGIAISSVLDFISFDSSNLAAVVLKPSFVSAAMTVANYIKSDFFDNSNSGDYDYDLTSGGFTYPLRIDLPDVGVYYNFNDRDAQYFYCIGPGSECELGCLIWISSVFTSYINYEERWIDSGNYQGTHRDDKDAFIDIGDNEYTYGYIPNLGFWEEATVDYSDYSITEIIELVLDSSSNPSSLNFSAEDVDIPVSAPTEDTYLVPSGSYSSDSEWLDVVLSSISSGSSVPTFDYTDSLNSISDSTTGILANTNTIVSTLESILSTLISYTGSLFDFLMSLPSYLSSLAGKFAGIWHYVITWVSSLGAWLSMMYGVWNGLPYAMVVPVYASAVIVIVVGMYRRFFM